MTVMASPRHPHQHTHRSQTYRQGADVHQLPDGRQRGNEREGQCRDQDSQTERRPDLGTRLAPTGRSEQDGNAAITTPAPSNPNPRAPRSNGQLGRQRLSANRPAIPAAAMITDPGMSSASRHGADRRSAHRGVEPRQPRDLPRSGQPPAPSPPRRRRFPRRATTGCHLHLDDHRTAPAARRPGRRP